MKKFLGYSVIELIVVMTVVILLGTVGLIAYNKSIVKARSIKAENYASNLKGQIELDVHTNLSWPENQDLTDKLSPEEKKAIKTAQYKKGNVGLISIPGVNLNNVKGYIKIEFNEDSKLKGSLYYYSQEEGDNIVWRAYLSTTS